MIREDFYMKVHEIISDDKVHFISLKIFEMNLRCVAIP